MKSKLKIVSVFITAAVIVLSCVTTRSVAANNDAARGPVISFNVFYQALSPYGRWANYSQYGQVWIPNLGSGFQPYSSNGHWVYSDYGWTWVSDYAWGWAPFHYGRWLYDNSYGWIWVPGEQWAPAWVAWRNSSNYYGWAPLGPGMSVNISIGIPAARWIFVPRPYFGSSRAYRYYLPRERNVTIIHNTTIIRNVNVYHNNRYFTGPSRTDVQHATRRTIAPVRIASASHAGVARVNNHQLSMFRPSVEHTGRPASRASIGGTSGSRPSRAVRPAASRNDHRTPAPARSGNANAPTRTSRPAAAPQTRSSAPAHQAIQRNSAPTRGRAARTPTSRVVERRRAEPQRTVAHGNTRVERRVAPARAERSGGNVAPRDRRSGGHRR